MFLGKEVVLDYIRKLAKHEPSVSLQAASSMVPAVLPWL